MYEWDRGKIFRKKGGWMEWNASYSWQWANGSMAMTSALKKSHTCWFKGGAEKQTTVSDPAHPGLFQSFPPSTEPKTSIAFDNLWSYLRIVGSWQAKRWVQSLLLHSWIFGPGWEVFRNFSHKLTLAELVLCRWKRHTRFKTARSTGVPPPPQCHGRQNDEKK